MSVPCREALTGSAHQVKGRERRGPRHQETTVPKYLLLKRRPRRYERRGARPPGPPGRPRSGRPSCRKVVSLSVLRPDSGTPGPPPVSSTDSKERKIMDPQEITEE